MSARTLSREQIGGYDEDQLWEAFVTRDRGLDGKVICAVRSTGIYCRPTCPARRPRRSMVTFYPSATEARGAGFRACLRCHPDRKETDSELVRTACDLIDDLLESRERVPTKRELVSILGVSPGRLQKLFTDVVGVTPLEYARGRRLERFKERARKGDSVMDSTYSAGYGSSSRLYEKAVAQLGMTPATYRKGGAGVDIRYVVAESALGGTLVAATGKGICSVKIGDDPGVLIAELRQEFPEANLLRVDAGGVGEEHADLRAWVVALLDYLDGRDMEIDLPMDVLATAFQWQVWRHLQQIPAGETRTYQEMAEALGKPTASRAVGRACATNPVAPIIPCHRAVRKDGGLAGYRWGLHRKEALLEMEKGQRGRQV